MDSSTQRAPEAHQPPDAGGREVGRHRAATRTEHGSEQPSRPVERRPSHEVHASIDSSPSPSRDASADVVLVAAGRVNVGDRDEHPLLAGNGGEASVEVGHLVPRLRHGKAGTGEAKVDVSDTHHIREPATGGSGLVDWVSQVWMGDVSPTHASPPSPATCDNWSRSCRLGVASLGRCGFRGGSGVRGGLRGAPGGAPGGSPRVSRGPGWRGWRGRRSGWRGWRRRRPR